MPAVEMVEALCLSRRMEGKRTIVTSNLVFLINRYAEIGVVSWGYFECVGRPGVFTRVAEYKEWINSVASETQDSNC